MSKNTNAPASKSFRQKLYTIIFEAETPAGRAFDIILLWAILLSVLLVLLESSPAIRRPYGYLITPLEWFFTILFSVEYLLRIYTTKRPFRYITSFYGIVDLMAILPTYLSLFIVGSQYLVVIRALRLLRTFRLLKLTHFVSEAEMLKKALKASRPKIIVFLFTVINIVIIVGAVMYVVEGPENGYTSIPTSMYWAIVTLTTVGYGDISPVTPLGQFLASILMIMGYGIIAIPTGIVTAELTGMAQQSNALSTRVCDACHSEGHAPDASFCKDCGNKL
jgi:voltage-gated potassium channel